MNRWNCRGGQGWGEGPVGSGGGRGGWVESRGMGPGDGVAFWGGSHGGGGGWCGVADVGDLVNFRGERRGAGCGGCDVLVSRYELSSEKGGGVRVYSNKKTEMCVYASGGQHIKKKQTKPSNIK